ncbi:MAG: aminoglycoside phosphotransferase family protein [Rickettsiaceae bacterium]|nr:aminoglycoside phosphotransferase family protein [Rickettsiaceae bacterium]
MKILEKNNISLFGQLGKDWILGLNKIINDLSILWELSRVEPVSNMSWNYVAKADSKKYGPVCIKISIDSKLISDEIQAIEHFNGRGMVKMLDYNKEHNALLLKQDSPGQSLKNIDIENTEQQINNYSSLVKKLNSAPNNKHNCLKNVRDWLTVFDRILTNKLPAGLVDRAKSLSNKLLSLKHPEYILHGDLHLDNIISDEDGYIAIDPKGIVGPIEFEVACFDFANYQESSQDIDVRKVFFRKLELLSLGLNLDQEVLKDWVFVRLVLGACWMIEDNNQDDMFLKRLKSIFQIEL